MLASTRIISLYSLLSVIVIAISLPLLDLLTDILQRYDFFYIRNIRIPLTVDEKISYFFFNNPIFISFLNESNFVQFFISRRRDSNNISTLFSRYSLILFLLSILFLVSLN
jgi:hypothetical protein